MVRPGWYARQIQSLTWEISEWPTWMKQAAGLEPKKGEKVDKQIRRVNLYGGPGSGKSTTAAWLFAELKARGFAAELVTEAIKPWAYDGRKPRSFDQAWLCAEQLRREDAFLRAGVRLVVTDSPVLQCAVYGALYDAPGLDAVRALAAAAEAAYPSLNFVLTYEGVTYDPFGRYQTADDAVEILNRTTATLRAAGHDFEFTSAADRRDVLKAVLDACRTSHEGACV